MSKSPLLTPLEANTAEFTKLLRVSNPRRQTFLTGLTVILILVLFAFTAQAHSAIEDKEWRKEEQSILRAYSSVSPTVRAEAMNRLAAIDHPGKVKVFVKTVLPNELKKNELPLINLTINLLGQLTDPEAINELIAATKKARSPNKIILMRAAGKIRSEETNKLLLELFKTSKRDIMVKMAAIDSLAEITPPEALSLVIQALESRNWEVRVSAVRYLARVIDEEGKKKALTALRSKMKKETGRLQNDISEAINVLVQSEEKKDDKKGGTFTFFDIPLDGDVIYVVDMSLSMNGQNADKVSRWQKLVEELKKAIELMSKSKKAKFNIIAYSDRIVSFQKSLVPAAKNKDQALKWIDKQRPGGFTNIYDALELALTSQASSQQGGKKVVITSGVPEPYTICFMTDGRANRGRYTTAERILASIRIINMNRKIRINTIALDLGVQAAMGGMGGMYAADNALMEAIAREHNGTFKAY